MGQSASSSVAPAQCPVDHKASSSAARCPVDHDAATAQPAASSSSSSSTAKCPVDHGALNTANNIPTSLAQTPAPEQTSELPTDRETSSIPRDDGARWEYPSPQQFYNALVRKGWETPEDSVEVMVHIHNFLNERAWQEVCRWEADAEGHENLQLIRLRGRPGELSPKARLHLLAGWLLPSRFDAEPPFDRHDWVVRRPGSRTEVRYVIDYYSAPPLPDGSPVFSLDVRPALDSPWSVAARAKRAWDEWKETSAPARS